MIADAVYRMNVPLAYTMYVYPGESVSSNHSVMATLTATSGMRVRLNAAATHLVFGLELDDHSHTHFIVYERHGCDRAA